MADLKMHGDALRAFLSGRRAFVRVIFLGIPSGPLGDHPERATTNREAATWSEAAATRRNALRTSVRATPLGGSFAVRLEISRKDVTDDVKADSKRSLRLSDFEPLLTRLVTYFTFAHTPVPVLVRLLRVF